MAVPSKGGFSKPGGGFGKPGCFKKGGYKGRFSPTNLTSGTRMK